MLCKQCGAPIESNEKFCSYCGSEIEKKSENEVENKGKQNLSQESKSASYDMEKNKTEEKPKIHSYKDDISEKINNGEMIPKRKKYVAILLAFFCGFLGIHRIYLGELSKFLVFIGNWIVLIVYISNIEKYFTSSIIAALLGIILAFSPFILAIKDIISYIRMDKVQWSIKYGYREN